MLSGMDEQLAAVLAVLVGRTGADAARVVDARSGGVLAQVGVIPAEDVRTLVALARDAAPATDGQDDLVLTTSSGVHVLRAFPGAFVHLRVGAGPGVVVARRELASPALRQAVGGGPAGIPLRTVPVPHLPRPRHAQPGDPEPHESQARPRHARPPRPHPPRIEPPQVPPARTPHDRPEPRHSGPSPDGRPLRQPALAAIGPAARHAQGAGPLAVLALSADAATPVTLPQRAVGAVAAPGPQLVVARPLALPAVLRQEWAGDAATMSRLIDGLRRLN